MSHQFDRTAIHLDQHLFGELGAWVVVKLVVYAGYLLHQTGKWRDVVGGHDNWNSSMQLPQSFDHCDPGFRIDGTQGLVEEQDLGLADESSSDQGALLQRCSNIYSISACDGAEPQPLQRPLDLAIVVLRIEAPRTSRTETSHLNYVEDFQGKALIEVGELRHIADSPAATRQVHRHRAGPGAQQPQDDLDQGRLATTVGSDDRQKVASKDLQRNGFENRLSLVTEADVTHFD